MSSVFTASELESRGETDTVIKFSTPAVAAGTGVLIFTDTDSGVSLAVSDIEVFAYPQGSPVLEASSPSSGISETDTSVYIELSNCPQSVASDVEVRFGNVLLPHSSFTSTRQATMTTVSVPSRMCTEDCVETVEISVKDRFGVPRIASIVYYKHRAGSSD